ncbi:unnamed protein product, partial [Ectocarpus sp. 13 AM-2016]
PSSATRGCHQTATTNARSTRPRGALVSSRQSIVPGKPSAPRMGAKRGSRPQSAGLLYFRAHLQRHSKSGDNPWRGETLVRG